MNTHQQTVIDYPATYDTHTVTHERTNAPSAIPKPHADFTADEIADYFGQPVSTLDVDTVSEAVASPSSDAEDLAVWPPVDADSTAAAEVSLPTPETESEETEAAPMVAEKPVWEVDRLRWPEHCREMLQCEEDYFAHAGQKLFEASEQGLSVLAITSSGEGEGCTTLALCLALAAKRAGARVAILDANLANPQLAKELGLAIHQSWREAVDGEIPWSEAAIHSLEDQITVLPLNDREELGRLKTEGTTALLSEVANHHDLVILDVGPLGRDCRPIFGDSDKAAVNAAIVVRDVRTTDENDTMTIAARLKSMGIQAVGIAENFTAANAASAAA